MKIFLKASWENLIMINYAVEPAILEKYLPRGVELDFFEGKTYVSLVGFMFKNTKIFGIPIPIFGTFEEINLRFYVKRIINEEERRGVVFINETVPNKIVAWLANILYKESYTAVPTKHKCILNETTKNIEYSLKQNKNWSNFKVTASAQNQKIEAGRIEEFIFEHYYGYTKASETKTLEYKVNHPSWEINKINLFEVNFDFENFYGKEFSFLKNLNPHSVMLAQGSQVSIDWKRNLI